MKSFATLTMKSSQSSDEIFGFASDEIKSTHPPARVDLTEKSTAFAVLFAYVIKLGLLYEVEVCVNLSVQAR